MSSIMSHIYNELSQLSPQGLCGNSCAWANDARFHTISTVHYVPKCMDCHEAILMKTESAHCFNDYIYITPYILFCWFVEDL